jgi:N utilization substance protein B
MKHTLSREIAMKRLYAETVGGTDSIEEALEQTERDMSEENKLFSDRLYDGVHAHQTEIDETIEAHAKDWSIQRIAKVDLSILRVAVYELLYETAIPEGATVNEAVELAKLFGGEKSAGFVNGILGAIAKEH